MVLGKKQSEPYFPGQSQSISGNQEMNLINGKPTVEEYGQRATVLKDYSKLWIRGPRNCSVESVSRVRPQDLGDPSQRVERKTHRSAYQREP